MDTLTHTAMGIGLAGLATVDPAAVSVYPAVVTAVMVGSQIPDIDTVLKFRNNAVYVKHHRGITHSIPFTLLWPIILTALIVLIFGDQHMTHIWLWAQIAVFLHVFVDIFNSYGTQALRPLTSKWIQIGIINTFDPFIFLIHVAGIILWAIGANPVPVFLSIYGILVFYYIIRRVLQQSIKKRAIKLIPQDEKIIKVFVAPTIRFFEWRTAIQTDQCDYIGRSYKTTVNFSDRFKRVHFPEGDYMEAVKKDANFKSFVNFSSIYRWTVVDTDNGKEVRFIDLRYLKNGHYSFVAILNVNEQNIVTHSYMGWVFSEEKLQRKLLKGKIIQH